MNHKQLMQQMADMKAQMDLYQNELENLRNQVAAYEDVETPIESATSSTTSRRKLLKRMAIAGIGGLGAIGLAAATNPNYTVLAAQAADNAIEAVGGAQGYGLQASGGLAPIYLIPSGTGAPTASGHQTGEIVVDTAGNIYFNVAGNAGGASSWRKLAGPNTAGTLHYLDAPDRFGDTRAGSTIGGKNTPFAANTFFDYQISGATGRDGTVLPSGIVGIVGNIIALAPSVGGLIKVLPGGTNTNIGAGIMSFGAVTSFNSFNAKLDSTGKVRVFFGGSGTTDILLDIVGYYL